MTAPILSVAGVSRRYGSALAVDAADLSLECGRILCLLGPSGCGKTTLLRMIAGLERPEAGTIVADGRLLSGPAAFSRPEDRRIGLVFQDYALFPHLTAAQNVAFGLRGAPRGERRRRALDLLDRFGLAHRADAWPHTLSGGEQQRVAIARALGPQPLALLLDEPFSGLDGELRAQLRETVLAGLRETRAAVLVVTHDPEEAMLLGDELALMSKGRIVQTGAPGQCYRRPRSLAAAVLLGRVNAVPARVDHGTARSPLGDCPAPDLPDGPATVLVRPESLLLGGEGPAAIVREVRFGGAYHEVALDLDGHKLVARTPLPPLPGDRVPVAAAPGAASAVAA